MVERAQQEERLKGPQVAERVRLAVTVMSVLAVVVGLGVAYYYRYRVLQQQQQQHGAVAQSLLPL